MGSRDWPINDRHINLRLPDELVLLVEIVGVVHCSTFSETVRYLLDSHPEIGHVRGKLVDMVNSTGRDDRP